MPVKKVGIALAIALALAVDMMACRDVGQGAEMPDQPGEIRLLSP